MMLTLRGPQIYTDAGVVSEISIHDGKIAELSVDDVDQNVLEFPASYTVVPGFIDLHVHGMAGVDVMDASHHTLQALRQNLAMNGTTAFLATTMSSEDERVCRVLENVYQQKDFKTGAEILGVHLEGPFISPAKCGAQQVAHITRPTVAQLEKFICGYTDVVKLVTLAPELQGADEVIAYLRAQGIVVSMGHTDATYIDALNAIKKGCGYATHLFNAMRSVHHREPGVAVAALLDTRVTVELIADGKHLHPAMLELVLKMKGFENVVLVTDAMRGACMHDGCYELGGQEIVVQDGAARLIDGTLAGSTLTMPRAFKNILRMTKCTVQDAVRMCCLNPARVVGVSERKGSLAVGKDADLLVLDEHFDLVMTICGGELFAREGVGAVTA